MDPQIITWIVSLIAGGAGGNIVGALLKNRNLGPMLNTVLGLVGGGLGGKILPMLVPAIGSLVGGTDSLAGTGGLAALVGAVLPLIVSFLKKPALACAAVFSFRARLRGRGTGSPSAAGCDGGMAEQADAPLRKPKGVKAHSTYVDRRLGGGKSLVAGARIRPRLLERSPTLLPPDRKPQAWGMRVSTPPCSTQGRCALVVGIMGGGS